jgi:hypothetical protein
MSCNNLLLLNMQKQTYCNKICDNI